MKRGFTLVELLVVISIISLLSSVVFASVNSARNKAKYARAGQELNQFVQAAIIAQGERGNRLQNITGSGCSDCVCRGRDDRNIPITDACYTQWINALTRIQQATGGIVLGLDRMTRDPWGSPYTLDENEREASSLDCRFDTVRSNGPNGVREDESCTRVGDDFCYLIPHAAPCP